MRTLTYALLRLRCSLTGHQLVRMPLMRAYSCRCGRFIDWELV